MDSWKTKRYQARLKTLRDKKMLDMGMMTQSGDYHYSPFHTPNIDDYYFDFDNARDCCAFIESEIKLFQGGAHTSAGEFMVLLSWQRAFISNIFGWKVKKTGLRRYREGFIYVPRGNGKTSFIGAIALMFMMMEDEGGIQVICGANSKEQAQIPLDFARNAILQNENLQDHFKTYAKAVTGRFDMDSMKSISNDPGIHDGLNICFGINDEIHEFKNERLPNIITGSQIKRSQPLYMEITTAASQGENYCNDRVQFGIKVATGEWEADYFLPCMWYMEDGSVETDDKDANVLDPY
ncbi:MAG: hypothetical protein HRT89_03255, partial [Lentisphaeria bacterium]|nr:terminase large subunit [Lentisphaeria bacterium]NQZ67068.1 hypothetical protein [Lentisphaeria bacterium]